MRFNIKVILSIFLVGTLFISINFWSRCTDISRQDNNFYRDPREDTDSQLPARDLNQLPDTQDIANHDETGLETPAPYTEIDCVINDEYSVGCRKQGSEVFLPFSFISKYFEVYGKVEPGEGGTEHLAWHHSYSKVYPPKGRYTPSGVFMSFEHYNVEVRDRVKCVSAIDGVPISTQWGPEGYHYPIQIAQYGLSHYSKYLIDKSRKVIILEDAEDTDTSRWSVLDKTASVRNVRDPQANSRVVQFSADEALHNSGVTLPVNTKQPDFFMAMDFMFVTNGSITVTLETKGKSPQLFYIHYVCSRTLIEMVGNEVYYGMGDRTQWTNIHRDLSIDLSKGLLLQKTQHSSGKKKKVNINKVVSITFRGQGAVDNITLSNNAHLAQFYYAANWLVLHQDDKGGWPIFVTRKLASGKLELPPGWYSAMAQGQAMSLLIRAYHRTNNPKYLSASVRAMRLFDVPSSEGGVLAMFADKYPWYEEYPTLPHSFVLNGFIYSLIGLYDLKTVAPREDATEAERIYRAGIESLAKMLPLFDTGSGSIYDLRHFTLGSAPNLARWDYHATHVNQLLLLSTIESDQTFSNTAKRWVSYMNGQRAAHN